MIKKINAIIVDDEERARDVLSTLIERHCPQIHIQDQCKNVKEAIKSIQNHRPNVVFLDIEMPEQAGYELVEFFDPIDFEIIFVTAYDHYAIKAFELSAIDYLLKPVEIKRLKEAIARVEDKIGTRKMEENYKTLVQNLKKEQIDRIIIPHNREQLVISLNEILALEAKESYSVIHCENGKNYMVSKNLKHFESLLEDTSFFRSHKSWLINTSKIISYSKKSLEVTLSEKVKAKLSKYKKAKFEEDFF